MKNLFVQDSPPIWRVGVESRQEESHVAPIWRASVSVFGAYLKRNATVFLHHAIIVLVLLLAVYWVRRGVHKWTEQEPSLLRAAPVFEVPVSTAIVLSFLITGPIYSLAPFLVRAILGGTILIPAALILRRLIDRTLYPILNALLVLYFVDQLRLITAAVPTVGPIALRRRNVRRNSVSDLADSE